MNDKLKENLKKAKFVEEAIKELPITETEKNVAVMTTALGANPVNFLVSACSRSQTQKAEAEAPLREDTPKDYTPIERAIHEMLTESTGTNILDSGGASGRHWQQNRAIQDFRELEACNVEIHAPRFYKNYEGKRKKADAEILITYNIFHYLTNFLEIDDECVTLQKAFSDYSEKEENRDVGYYALMEEFAEKELQQYGFTYGGGFNSYNYENLLSQVIQAQWLHKNGDEYDSYLMLQIHNGADVRGGYTAPRVFRVSDRDYFIIAQNDVRVSCQCGHCNFYSDDGGYNWYSDNDNGELKKRIRFKKNRAKNAYGKDKAMCKKCDSQLVFGVMEDF